MKIKTGDTVQILLGKDRGKTGKVLRVWTKENKILVEGVNIYKRHIKKTKQHEGGIIDIPKPLNFSNVSLICPSCKKKTRISMKIELNKQSLRSEDLKKIRICKKCHEEIKMKKESK